MDYTSVQSAVNAAQEGDTIQLMKDITENVGIGTSSSVNFTIDLNGKQWIAEQTGGIALNYNGIAQMTLTDTKGGGALDNPYTGNTANTLSAGNNTVVIDKATVTSIAGTPAIKSPVIASAGKVIVNAGSTVRNDDGGQAPVNAISAQTVIVNGGTVTGGFNGIYSEISTTINGGTVTGGDTGIVGKGEVIINRGTVKNGIRNNGVVAVTINGGIVTGSKKAPKGIISFDDKISNNGGKVALTIKAGTVKNDLDPNVYAVYFNDPRITGNNLGKYYQNININQNNVGKVFPVPAVAKISITTPPTKAEYTAGESFDSAGMVVRADYTDSSHKDVTSYTVSPKDNLQESDSKVTVSYTESGVTKTADVAITVKAAPAVTSVSVTPPTANVEKGGTQEFTAAVDGTNNPAQTVTWTVEGGADGTSINGEGLLTVAAGEPAESLTVKATSTVDESQSGTATVTVKEAAPAVTSVSVTPATANVEKGGTQQFSATVNGTNNPAQTVTWTVEGGADGTSINGDGLLTVAAGEPAESLTVKATSTVDSSKFGTATVTVKEAAPAVTSVSVTSATANVQKGGTQQFSATVNGTNNPATTVKWTVEGGADGTSINGDGLLTVAADETAASLTVKATSTADSSKSGTAAVTVTSAAPVVTNVSVTPATATVQKGGTQQFSATVNGTNNPAQTVTWTVEGGADGTSINGDGLLTVAADETAASLTVKATSTADESKSGTAAVTVTSQGTAPIETHTITATAGKDGSISPSGSVTVEQGQSRTFTMTPDSNCSIADVKVDSQSKGVISSYTFENVTGNHSIEAIFIHNGGDSHSGGGSGGGGESGGSHSGNSSSGGNSQSSPESTSAEPGTGISNITASVDENGSANATITGQHIKDAVNEAKKGANDGAITVIVNVSSQGKDADSLSVNLPETVQEQVISEKIAHLSIRVDKPEISVGFNLAAITAINKQANADVEIAAERIDRTKLSAEAQAAIGSRPAFDLTATYAGGTKNVSSFGRGSATLEIPYTLGKGELADRICAVYVDENGKVQYLNNSSYDVKRQVLRVTTGHFSVYGVGYRTPAFTDIEGHWAKDDILFAANRNLLIGTSATTFSPDEAVTGEMLVTALGRMAGIDPADYKTGKFTDVEPDAYYAPYMNWAAEKGIVNSTSIITFAPDRAISREQMVVIMIRYANAMGYQIPETQAVWTFADSGTISDYAVSAVKQMQMAGILSGRDGNLFDPQKNATRGEAASLLHRYVEHALDRSNS